MVEQYDVYTHYSQFGFTPSMINDDIVFTLQNRFVSMSDSQRNEYGIDLLSKISYDYSAVLIATAHDDFIDIEKLFEPQVIFFSLHKRKL